MEGGKRMVMFGRSVSMVERVEEVRETEDSDHPTMLPMLRSFNRQKEAGDGEGGDDV